ncbi:thioredoxin TrxC [Sinorhizobium sp. Sb3]|uniref:thioredoxin TrxC n=1 Tax=Sinorhizobium/Ensifer group TaxID=227292 RepID=UPI00071D28D6|nr:thioredoxin TrxC [Sinorhizobium sp. Sb3]
MSASRHVVCPHCAAVNRLTANRDAGSAKCGVCKQGLFVGRPVDANAEMLTDQISRSDIPVLVDVWAPWCGPCRMMAPAFAEAAKILEPGIRVVKLNSEEHQKVAAQLGIQSIPTLLLFQGGRELARTSGAMNTRQIVDWTGAHLNGQQRQPLA